VTQVRGFADQSPRVANDRENASNRRVTLIIQYQRQEGSPEAGEQSAKGEGHNAKPAEHGAPEPAAKKPSPTH
jgi:hypothetical protein